MIPDGMKDPKGFALYTSEVAMAFVEGKVIECKLVQENNNGWILANNPTWNWHKCDYRIRQPKNPQSIGMKYIQISMCLHLITVGAEYFQTLCLKLREKVGWQNSLAPTRFAFVLQVLLQALTQVNTLGKIAL